MTKKIPIKKYKITAGSIIFDEEMPIVLMTISSEFLIRFKKARRDPK